MNQNLNHNPLAPTVPLPNDLDAERAFLGLAINNPTPCLTLALTCLESADFYDEGNRKIFTMLREEHGKGTPIVPAALVPAMLASGINPGEFANLTTGTPHPDTCGHFLAQVKNCATNRKTFAACYQTLQELTDQGSTPDPSEVIGSLKARIAACEATTATSYGNPLNELWLDLIDNLQSGVPKSPAIGTGIAAIDSRTRGGPRRGQAVLIGALRHVGKTALLRQIALNCGKAGHKTLCMFMESADADEAAYTLAAFTGVPAADFSPEAGQPITKATKDALLRATSGGKLPITIDTEASLTIDMVENRARLHKATKGLDVLMVDYLQLLASQHGRNITREQAIAEDARRLKVLAKELNIVLYFAAQLNDNVEACDTPEMRHVRESKGPVNHADIVLLMSAPDGIDHLPGHEREPVRRHLYNRKWRGVGAFSGPFELLLRGETQQFLNDQTARK